MKAAVITFPGSNCDDDAIYILSRLLKMDVSNLWHKDTPELTDYKLIVLPGGFSYGDYLRCGTMAALSPIVEKVKEYAAQGGLVLGICNGFQILCEAGLLPGALARNEKLHFICKDVDLVVENSDSPWTSNYSVKEKIRFPIAHGEGRYVADADTLANLKKNQQVLFRYADNINGSLENIAGICNQSKNIFGLMPHPERATDLRGGDGMKLWNSVLQFLVENPPGKGEDS